MTTTSPPPAVATVDEPVARFALRAVPLVAVGGLLGGWIGLVAAAVGVASTFRRPPTLVAAAAPVALAVAALATVIEVPVDSDALRSSFADDRPVAATAGLVAALLALTAVVTLAVRDRAPVAARGTVELDPPAAPARPRLAALLGVEPTTRRQRALIAARTVGTVVGLGIVLALLAPRLPAGTDEVADNVRLGRGWGTLTDEATVAVDGTEPPLAVVVAAVAPGGPAVWTGLAGMAALAAVAALAARRVGDDPDAVDLFWRLRWNIAMLVAAPVGAILVLGRTDLAAALAAALVGGALLVGDPAGRTPWSALLAGALYGGAVLAVPVLALALPLVVAALAVDPRTRAVTAGHGLAGLVGAVVVVAPWQRWLVERFDTWAPAAEVRLPLPSLVAVAAVLAAPALAALLTRRLH